MTRSLSIVLIVIAFSATLYGQQTTDRRTFKNLLEGDQQVSGAGEATPDSANHSPAVKKILDEAVGEVKKNRQAFEKANEKPIADARVKLQDMAKKLVDEGKADEATAMLGQVKTLDADVMRRADTASGSRSTSTKPLLERMAGRWTHPNCPLVAEISPSGFIKEIKKSGGMHSEGRLRQISVDEVEAKLTNGWTITLRIIDDNAMVLRGYRPEGGEMGEGFLKLRMK